MFALLGPSMLLNGGVPLFASPWCAPASLGRSKACASCPSRTAAGPGHGCRVSVSAPRARSCWRLAPRTAPRWVWAFSRTSPGCRIDDASSGEASRARCSGSRSFGGLTLVSFACSWASGFKPAYTLAPSIHRRVQARAQLCLSPIELQIGVPLANRLLLLVAGSARARYRWADSRARWSRTPRRVHAARRRRRALRLLLLRRVRTWYRMTASVRATTCPWWCPWQRVALRCWRRCSRGSRSAGWRRPRAWLWSLARLAIGGRQP